MPTSNSERIRFIKESDSRYCLVHEGTLEGSANLWFVVRLLQEELGLKLKRGGYFGHGGFSSQTFHSPRPINTRAFGWRLRHLMSLPPHESAALVRIRKLLGPKAGEPGFKWLNEQSSASALKRWCCDYYAGDGIDCPESFAALERHSVFRWRRIPAALLRHNLEQNFQTPLKVEVYRQLLAKGVALPPLICLRRGWDLLEGYHRLAAHEQAGNADVPCIVIGKDGGVTSHRLKPRQASHREMAHAKQELKRLIQ